MVGIGNRVLGAIEQNPSLINGMTQPGTGMSGLGSNFFGMPANMAQPQAPRFLPSTPIEIGAPDAKASQIDATIRPFLTEGLRQAQEIFLRQQPSFFPGQTYVSPSAATTESIAQQEAIARQQSPVLQQAQQSFLGGLTAQ